MDYQLLSFGVALITQIFITVGIALRNERRHTKTEMMVFYICDQLDIKHPELR